MRFRWLRDSHAQHRRPSAWGGAAQPRRNGLAGPSRPGFSPGCKKKEFWSPSLGPAGGLAAPRRRLVAWERCSLLTPDAVISDPRLAEWRPDYSCVAFWQSVALSTGKFAWLGPPTPKVIPRLVPGLLRLRGLWSSWSDPSLGQE